MYYDVIGGQDYISIEQTVSPQIFFGILNIECVQIPTIDDNQIEGNEVFNVMLRTESSIPLTLFMELQVTLADNDFDSEFQILLAFLDYY